MAKSQTGNTGHTRTRIKNITEVFQRVAIPACPANGDIIGAFGFGLGIAKIKQFGYFQNQGVSPDRYNRVRYHRHRIHRQILKAAPPIIGSCCNSPFSITYISPRRVMTRSFPSGRNSSAMGVFHFGNHGDFDIPSLLQWDRSRDLRPEANFPIRLVLLDRGPLKEISRWA